MRRFRLGLVVAALAALAGSAQAQETSGLQVYGVAAPIGSGTVVSQTMIPARLRGELVVDFHGDAAAGCATYGLCAYSGTIVVRPRDAEVSFFTVRRGGRIRHVVLLGLVPDPPDYITSARVQRSISGGPSVTCADGVPSSLAGQTAGVIHGRSVTLRLLVKGGSLLQTRCAGPLDGDLSTGSSVATVPLSRLRHGRTSLDLSGASTFASHGFAGTISSTLTMTLGKPSSNPTSGQLPPAVKIQRTRVLSENLRVLRVGGRLTATILGTREETVCGLLDSCGLSGTLSMSDVAHDASAQVTAIGAERRPYRDFLAALGLSRSGRSRGISVVLQVNWTGAVRATVDQGADTCTDAAATGGVALASGFGVGGVGAFTGSWRTRCPGPIFNPFNQVLIASFNRATLGHREFSVRVRAKGSPTDDGYVIVPHGRLSMLLRRGRITQQVISAPAG
ncbi:MAG: hypothetical protein ACTHMY_14900 [Solirubrobacteraceae bacterium]